MPSTAIPYIASNDTCCGIIEFSNMCTGLITSQLDVRSALERNDRLYQREVDRTEEQRKAWLANRRGDPTKFQNIVLPVIMPQVENAVTYQVGVFLSQFPIFKTVASAANVDVALQMDTIVGNQQVKGNWVQELIIAFRDAFKHNLMAVECDWERQVTFAPQSKNKKEIIWEGNKIKRMDLYNTFWDMRVAPTDVAKYGEFAGKVELMSRIRLKQFLSELPFNQNVAEAFNSGVGGTNIAGSGGYDDFYIPTISDESDELLNPQTWQNMDWFQWVGLPGTNKKNIDYKNMYIVKTIYARILPSDFKLTGVDGQNTPQVWKFILVNNQVVIYCERLTNVHGYIPMLFAQAINDGLGYQTKSFAKNLEPIQSIMTAVANSDVAARRRAISDRMAYDSSRVSAAHMQSDSPISRIPVRPSAAGGAIGNAFYQIPFNDNQFQFNQATLAFYDQVGTKVSGLNPVRQGQFVKGNKTNSQFDATMDNSGGRDQLTAISFEADLFTPLKEIIKSNIIQYQGGVTLFNPDTQNEVKVDPQDLQTAMLAFKLSDGLIPSEQMIDSEGLTQTFQAFSQMAGLAQGFNTVPMFTYLMKSQGADLRPFQKSPQQIAYEGAVAQWNQMAQMIAASLSKLPDVTPQIIQQAMKQLPPQPTPQQFGYVPGQLNQVIDPNQASSPTILQQVVQNTNAGTASNSGSGSGSGSQSGSQPSASIPQPQNQ